MYLRAVEQEKMRIRMDFDVSTSFANPAVTIARGLSNTFAGIMPAHVPGFIVAQLVGALAAMVVYSWLLKEEHP